MTGVGACPANGSAVGMSEAEKKRAQRERARKAGKCIVCRKRKPALSKKTGRKPPLRPHPALDRAPTSEFQTIVRQPSDQTGATLSGHVGASEQALLTSDLPA